MDFSDVCYECTGYGDNYSVNDDGELVCNCDECYVTLMEMDWGGMMNDGIESKRH